MKVEAKVEVTLPQVKEFLEPVEAGRGQEWSSPQAFKGSTALSKPYRTFKHKVQPNLLAKL